MEQERNYTIGRSRLQRSCIVGMRLDKDGTIHLEEGERHILILPVFRGAVEKSRWGRFHVKAEMPKEGSLYIYAFARDAVTAEEKMRIKKMECFFMGRENDPEEKIGIFKRADGIGSYQAQDILLYELEGQYLWIALEIVGCSAGSLKELFLYNPGEQFLKTFPEVYQNEGFFQRYLSIFSSMYTDMQKKINQADRYLDPERAPAKMLPVLAGWLGIDVQKDFLEESILRRLLKEAYHLNKLKGTRAALEKLAEIVLETKIQVIEKNLLEEKEEEAGEIYRRLYGKTEWDVTILVNRVPEEKLQEQFFYLAEQFKPVRCRIHLEFYQNYNMLDSYCFLDQNAKLIQSAAGKLEDGNPMDGSVILE